MADAGNDARRDFCFDLRVYVFMPEHTHFIAHPREARYDVADIRKAIKSPVGRRAIAYLEQTNSPWLPKVTRRRGDKTERVFRQPGGG